MSQRWTDEEYLSASAAARLLGVSRQRVSAMIRDGDLPAVYPWPRAVRIPRTAITAWQAGQRQLPVHRTAARAYVVAEAGVHSPEWLRESQIRTLCRRFIAERRPKWSASERREWADQMAKSLSASS